MIKVIVTLLTCALLTACVTPMRLGMSETEWESYSPQERQKIKQGYYQILKTSTKSQAKPSDGSKLQVHLSSGKVGMPPFSSLYPYNPVSFEVQNGHCKDISISEENGDKKVTMKACYQGKTLYLDPSHYDTAKRQGSIQLHYSPIWDRELTYNGVSSSGYVHLTNINVTLKRINANESADNGN